MNPYARFGLVSNTVSAALIVAGLAVFGGPVFSSITKLAGGSGPALWGATGGGITVLVVFWLAMNAAIFPTLFRFNAVRRLVLGKYYVEGTWLQAERGAAGGHRLAVIDIQPSGNSFIFSGYALNQDLEIESNTLIEFSKFEWPFMTYKYRNSLSDGADGQREGVGEIQFEMNRSAAVRYNGYAQFVKNARRLKIDGAKLVKNAEVRKLRSLEGRRAVLEKYWGLFFSTSLRIEDAVNNPKVDASPIERQLAEAAAAEAAVVQRRRTSDWRQDDATPTVSRARTDLSARASVIEDVRTDADDAHIDLAYETNDTAETDMDAKVEDLSTASRRALRR
jgi:hypothetical protein